MVLPNNMFTGYNPKQLQTLAQKYGYNEANLDNFGKFLEENPARAKQYFDQQNMDMFGADKMRQFQQGGTNMNMDSRNPYGFTGPEGIATQMFVPYYNQKTGERWTAPSGGWTPPSADWTMGSENPVRPEIGLPPSPAQPTDEVTFPGIGQETTQRLFDPRLPSAGQFQATYVPFEQAQLVPQTAGQLPTAPTIGQATTVTPADATAPTQRTATEIAAATAVPAAQQVASQAAQAQAPSQTIEAAQQAQTQVANVQAAQAAQATQVAAPTARTLQAGEQIAAPTGQAAQAAAFVDPVAQAAQAAPTEAATVQGQLATLLQQFEGGDVPAWAKGAIRTAQQTLLARGLGASSIAGQAIVQAAMEVALPIAQLDAATVAKFEAQNLSNRQQAAITQAQYRAQFMGQEFDQAFQGRVQNAAKVADIGNRNFTAEQQIALENSKLTQTVDLTNLSNKQALIMANAGTLSQLDIANLNNRQQAAVQNAQNFLQVDMKNLDNSQQSAVLNSQQQLQALFTDTAAENTVRQLNATNQQQVDQFYDNLNTTVSQFNAAQNNAILQKNADSINAIAKFNSELTNMRDQFEATNRVAIDQSNATWRRKIATEDTAVVNFENQVNAQNALNMSNQSYNNLWQEFRDMVEYAFTSGESELERMTTLQLAALNADSRNSLAQFKQDREDSRSIGGFIGEVLKSPITSIVSGLFGG